MQKLSKSKELKAKKYIYMIIGLIILLLSTAYIYTNCNKDINKDIVDITPIQLFEISAWYTGRPYEGNAIKCDINNEGINDTLESFDCVTYVEGVLADILARNEKVNNADKTEMLSWDTVEVNKEDIKKYIPLFRYKDGIAGKTESNNCFTRNHFFVSQWLSNHKDLFVDITDKIGPTKSKSVIIDYAGWFKKIHNIDLKEHNKEIKSDKVKINYIEFKDIISMPIEELGSKLPPASLMMLVTKKQDSDKEKFGTDTDVSHVGFLFNTYNKYYDANPMIRKNITLRHASSTNKEVVEIDLYSYIKSIMDSDKLSGIMIYEIKTRN